MAGLIGLALTSCEEDNSLGVMQKNDAPVIVSADGVALKSLYAPTGNNISLQNFEESGIVPLVDIEISSDFPEASTVTGEVQISNNADFNNAQTIALNSMEAASQNPDVAAALEGPTRSLKGYVDMAAWEDAYVALYGLNPNTNVNYVRYKLWLNEGKQNVILYNNNGEEWFDPMLFNVTPLDAKLDVAPSYTLHYIVGNNPEQTKEMYHNPATHVYDDPVFSTTVENTEGADGTPNQLLWWITATNDESRAYGVVGDPAAESGDLAVINGQDGIGSGLISIAGVIKIEVDMLELTFTTKLAPPSLYVVSTSGVNFNQAAQLGTEDNVVYSGMAGILNSWGLAGQAAYKPTLYVNNPDVERTSDNGTYTGGLKFDTTGAPLNANSAIPYPGTGQGLYYITADLQSLTYTGYQCKTIGLVGSPNGWGDDFASLKGSRTTFFMEWTVDVELKAGDEWKIRANQEWNVNFGGADGGNYPTDGSAFNLAMDGANLVAAEDGTYTVTVYFRRYLDENNNLTPYYMTVTKK